MEAAGADGAGFGIVFGGADGEDVLIDGEVCAEHIVLVVGFCWYHRERARRGRVE